MRARALVPALALAALPLTPVATPAAELGGELRISDMGPVGAEYAALFPHVAYNPVTNQYLVVWQGDDDAGGSQNNESEIFGQRIDAATGQEIGPNDFRISDMGGTNVAFGAASPRVAYNAADNEFLVVWHGDDNVGGLVDDEWEIFGQRLDAAGNPIGADDFRISQVGGTGNTTYQAKAPAVAWSSAADEYLVVWVGDDESVAQGELEVFGQRLDADGVEIGADDFRVTDLGVEAFNWYIVYSADVVYNPDADEYLVVCSAEDDQGGMTEGELEIFAQRLDGETGAELGNNDFRVSDMGDSGTASFTAQWPRVAYHPGADEYLVVWRGDDNVGGLVDGEHEVFGQRLAGATGAELGANDFRISSLGGNGNVDFGAAHPEVAANPAAGTYLVVWWGFAAGGLDVFGQYLSATGTAIGVDDELLSDDAIAGREAIAPTVAYAAGVDQHLVVWYGDQPPSFLNEDEIYGQRTSGSSPLFADGFESGNTSAWSSTTP